ncbi:unnamed protein product [Scytosiphon promiscuus]
MSDFLGRVPYDTQSEDDEEGDDALADPGQDTVFRRMAASSGPVATATSHQTEHFVFGSGPKGPPDLDSEPSGESLPSQWADPTSGNTDPTRLIPSSKASGGYGYSASPISSAPGHSHGSHGYGTRDQQSPYVAQAQHHKQHPSAAGAIYNPVMSGVPGFTSVEPPGFCAPFSNAEKSVEGSSSYDDDSDSPCVRPFPITFRLERTNFVVGSVSSSSTGRRLELGVESLLEALRRSLSAVGVDVLEFEPAHCALECSSHVGNRFLSIFVRVFRAPDHASGQLLKSTAGAYGKASSNRGQDEEEGPFLVEAQLREGDRLHFSALFPEIVRAVENQEGMKIMGTLCYKPRAYPEVGQGLALEEVSRKSSRGGLASLAERKETLRSGGNTPAADRFGAGGAVMGASFPPPVPVSMAKASADSDDEFDEDMNEDLMVLTKMLRGNYLDVQADAAMAVAGLTADSGFLRQLCRVEAAEAAMILCFACARLLVETSHRPARRQAAVIIANLSMVPKLRTMLLASDPPYAAHARTPVGSLDPYVQQRGLVNSLVVYAMGMHGGEGVAAGNKKEEEIGMRRACMHALVGLAESEEVRNTRAMKLLALEPSGRGGNDSTLVKHLDDCRAVLKNRS